jgi:predicted NUDIX family phosphoesterase
MSDILVFPRAAFDPLPDAGAWPVDDLPEGAAWRPRAAVEHDERWLQPIPYLLLLDRLGHAWCYRRCGGDARLDGRRSCGLGGHVERIDAAGDLARTLANALRRELTEELGLAPERLPEARPHAWLYEGRTAVGRVHLGVVYTAVWTHADPPEPPPGEPLEGLGFRRLAEIAGDARFELWSRLAADYLEPPR